MSCKLSAVATSVICCPLFLLDVFLYRARVAFLVFSKAVPAWYCTKTRSDFSPMHCYFYIHHFHSSVFVDAARPCLYCFWHLNVNRALFSIFNFGRDFFDFSRTYFYFLRRALKCSRCEKRSSSLSWGRLRSTLSSRACCYLWRW